MDVGANVGKFAILSSKYNPDIHTTIVDLHNQLQNAINNVAEAKLSVRRVHDNIGNCHTLFECGKNEKLNVEHKY